MFYERLMLVLLLLLKKCSICSSQSSDISMNKPAYQSSTYSSDDLSYGPGLAVDGDTSGTCSRTGLQTNPYWYVDLDDIYSVNYVLIYIPSGFEESLIGTEIRVASDESSRFSGALCGSITSSLGYHLINCDPDLIGRYVSLYQTSTSVMEFSICEVQVYGDTINECDSSPCQNSGVCFDGINSYTCQCPSGFSGSQCETDVDECASSPCQNSGVCTDGINSYTCQCPSGFSGNQCQTDLNECEGSPCQNGGTCADGVNMYVCTCVAGWEGDNCESSFDDCLESPCINGGTCTDGDNDFSCECVAGWTGLTCSIDAESPTVMCPDDIENNTPTVTWSDLVVSDSVDTDLTATCTPSSGSLFNVGSTEVTCSATDAAGNIGSCVFTVIIIEDGSPSGNADDDDEGGDDNSTIIIVVVLIIVLIFLVVALVLVWKIRTKRRTEKGTSGIPLSVPNGRSGNGLEQHVNEPLTPEVQPTPENVASDTPDLYVNQDIIKPAIPVKDLPEYIRTKKAAGELTEEWELLPEGIKSTERLSVALESHNATKNRYRNVIPYDGHRVVLEKINDDPFSDYINACFIKGFASENAYIAAQGPNKMTVVDFWRMVWQENVPAIVMTTNLVEDGKNKCMKYWPDNVVKYGDLTISSISLTSKTSFTIRKLKIVKDKEARFVRQYHFLAWPDKNIPRSSSPVITMLTVIQNETPPNAGPILVHCSAGAGRTGAIIAIDAMMKMATETGEVNVFEFVKEMRNRRPNMVQTPLQYDFVYNALLEFVIFGETSCAVSEFKEHYNKLKEVNPQSKKTYISEEFDALQRLSEVIRGHSTKGGLRPENKDKNRYPDILPFDRNRPFIMTPGENGPSDYINASFFDSFDKKDMFIGTQVPLKNTVEDLWRMVIDYNARSVVVLNDFKNRDKTVAQFWPGKGSNLNFKHLTVSALTSESLSKQVNVHTVRIEKNEENKSLEVKIFEFLGWPANSYTPSSSKEFLQLVTIVNKWQLEIGDPTMVAMCMDGLGRTGVFCTTMSSLRRLTDEQTVDILQGVKLLRTNRPGMVQTLSQYEFIYKTVLEHLLAFEVYDNIPQEEALYANV